MEAMKVRTSGGYWKFMYFPFRFAVNLKLLLKKWEEKGWLNGSNDRVPV
jgi:hypothetical protein